MSFALCHCLCFLCSLPLLVAAQTNTNITLGKSLAAGDGSKWVSPSGDFAFGFQQVRTGGFLLAIWFDKIPDKTVTWSANRDTLAQRGSKLELTSDGRLVLSDPGGTEIWSPTSSAAAYAAMLDTGNFVLADKSSATFWQSFDNPTDTILPTQKMSQGTALVARFSDTNYSSGRFQLTMQDDGNLVFYTLNWPQDKINYFEYDQTPTAGSGFQVVFDQSGSIIVAAKNGTVVALFLSAPTTPAKGLYRRAILEFDGVFRMYVYQGSSSTNSPKNWTILDIVPQNICSQMNVDKGGGACGFNSYCQMGDDQRPKCRCPPRYSFMDQMDQMKGCKPDFNLQSCDEKTQENQFQIEAISDTDFWGLDYETFHPATEASCRQGCLSDCLCAAAVFRDQQCWKKRFPLSNGQAFDSRTTLIKVRNGNSTTTPEPAQIDPNIQPVHLPGGGHRKGHQTQILTESVLIGCSAFLNVLLLILAVFAASFCTYKRRAKALAHPDIPGTNMRNFSYKELEEATDGFKDVVGQGAFATVYKGTLDSEEGNVIAVKKLNVLVKENHREFESEVRAIARTDHRNLVRLIGFCSVKQHRLLVYKYMPNGSLADILFHEQRPSWLRRIKFALETARGLNYLHEECSIQIIHCDIKPQNVLIDASFTPRISDFGLAKLLKKDQNHTLTVIRGTRGYIAPEWFKGMPITTKVDVYSYGILLLELICCRRCFVAEMEGESQMILANWAYDCYKGGRIEKLVENDNEALTDIEYVKKFVMIALWCIREDPCHRPSMRKVVQMIEGALEEPLPQDLATHISSMNVYHGNWQPYSSEDFSNK